jgi:hypothetical protein
MRSSSAEYPLGFADIAVAYLSRGPVYPREQFLVYQQTLYGTETERFFRYHISNAGGYFIGFFRTVILFRGDRSRRVIAFETFFRFTKS